MVKQKIYIDGLGLVEGHFSGVGQYILGILRGMDDILEAKKYAGEPVPDVRVIIPRDSSAKFRGFGFKHIGYKKFPASFRVMSALWRRRWLPPLDLLYGKAVYIFPRFVSMPLLFSESALVIFDISYETHRQYADEGNAIFLSKQVKKSLQKTKKVITISQNARREIIDFYKLPGRDVKVALPAADPRLFYRRSPNEIKNVKSKYKINGDYILALSNLEPRKNLDSLVEAYCALPANHRQNTALLLVGVSGWKTDELFQKILVRIDEGYNIIRPSEYVLDEDKPAIISGAKLLVFPSHYEGFGMPPLEALACGVPAIIANNSSLPEVIPDKNAQVKSDDLPGLTKKIAEYLDNTDKLSAETITTGPKRARDFSWQRSAQVFLEVVEELS